MNKRGMLEHLVLYLFYIIVGIMIVVLLYINIKEAYTGAGFNKEFFANDVGMIIESAYIANNNLEIDYSFDKTYNVNIKDGVLFIGENIAGGKSSYLVCGDKNKLDFNLDTNGLRILNKKGVKVE